MLKTRDMDSAINDECHGGNHQAAPVAQPAIFWHQKQHPSRIQDVGRYDAWCRAVPGPLAMKLWLLRLSSFKHQFSDFACFESSLSGAVGSDINDSIHLSGLTELCHPIRYSVDLYCAMFDR